MGKTNKQAIFLYVFVFEKCNTASVAKLRACDSRRKERSFGSRRDFLVVSRIALEKMLSSLELLVSDM